MLTVECASSIWAQELTYLGGQLLARMNEVDPAHPVERFRFVTRRSPAADGDEPVSPLDAHPPDGATRCSSPAAAGGSSSQDHSPAASNTSKRDDAIQRADLEAARKGADEVGDEPLRKAILAALGAAEAEPPHGASGGPSVNHKK